MALLHHASLTTHPAPSSLLPAFRKMLQEVEASLTWLLTQPGDELEDEGIDFGTEFGNLQQRRNTLLRALGSASGSAD